MTTNTIKLDAADLVLDVSRDPAKIYDGDIEVYRFPMGALAMGREALTDQAELFACGYARGREAGEVGVLEKLEPPE